MEKLFCRLFVLLLAAMLPSAILSGCSGSRDNNTSDENDIVALYIPLDSDHLMIDESNSTVFRVSFPGEIYDINGNKITQEELKAGNRIRISGNGQMLESYPGQYPGVSRLEVVEEGSPDDIDAYQEVIDTVHSDSVITDVPAMNIEYVTPDAIVSVFAEPLSYDWMSDDTPMTKESCHILEQKYSLPDIRISDPTDLSLVFSSTPDKITILKYDAEEGTPESGISVPYSQFEDENEKLFTIPKVFDNYIYEIYAEWPEGHVTFGFQIFVQ